MTAKSGIRREMAQRLAQLSSKERYDAGVRLLAYFTHLTAKHVVLFKSLRDEIDLSPLTRWLESQGAKLYCPRYARGNPELEFDCDWSDVDLLIVPGVAFDRQGHRLGRGLGCYDRLIARLRRERPDLSIIGVCMDCQILDEIPVDSHDEMVDKVYTETQIYERPHSDSHPRHR